MGGYGGLTEMFYRGTNLSGQLQDLVTDWI